ncbi:MAG: hypothetical protein PHP62_00965 [Candidatus Moranbacteria bacterium]|nr:hypothetical protein [Candidatus Moranbacteria bacterium]
MKLDKSFFISLAVVSVVGTMLVGVDNANAAIITCGRGQDMCTLCDLIAGMNTIIQYLMKLSIGVALLAMAIGGVMYVISAGDKGLADKAKGAITNAVVGFAIIFAGWLIINTTINYIGTKPGMGIGVTSWGNFECNRVEPILNK